MKVLLTYPEFPNTYWSFRHALSFEGRLLKESTGNNSDGSLNFIPRMDATRLVEGYQRILRRTD